MGHAFAHLDHRERRPASRLDDLEQRGILQIDAVRLQADFDDGLADVIGDGGFRGHMRQGGQSTQYPAAGPHLPQNSFLTRMSSA